MSNETVFIKTLAKVDLKSKVLIQHAYLAKKLYECGRTEEAYIQSLNMEETSEEITLLTRSLPVYTGKPNAADDVETIIEKSIPVKIGFTDKGWFSIRIFSLLPRKDRGSVNYIRQFLFPAMRDFFLNTPPVRYADCVIIFRHVYNRNTPERLYRDHDNIEVNIVTDILAMYTMSDDGPAVCSNYYCSACGTEDRTEVYVVPKSEFSEWLLLEKRMPDYGITLYETR